MRDPQANGESRARQLERARAGDDGAFGSLLQEHRDRLFTFLRRLLGDHHDAEDAFQETVVKAWRSLDGLRDADALESWLFRIARNTAYDLLRSRQRDEPQEAAPDVRPSDDVPSPEAVARGRELADRVDAFLRRLPTDKRETLLLRMHTTMTFRQIAEVRREKLSTVLSRVHRTLADLRDHLEDGE